MYLVKPVRFRAMLLALFTCALPLPSFAQSSGLTGAMPPFAVDGKQYGELGRDLQSLLTAHLSAQDNVIMVERAEPEVGALSN